MSPKECHHQLLPVLHCQEMLQQTHKDQDQLHQTDLMEDVDVCTLITCERTGKGVQQLMVISFCGNGFKYNEVKENFFILSVQHFLTRAMLSIGKKKFFPALKLTIQS